MSRLDSSPPLLAHAWQSERLNILLALQDALYFQQRPEAMAELSDQIQALLDAVGTAEQSAQFYARLNQIALLQNRFRPPAKNVAMARKALAEAQTASHIGLVARQEFHLGFHLLWRDNHAEAEPMLQRALTKAEKLGDSWLHTQSLVYLTILYRLQGKQAQVAAYLPQLEESAQQIGNHLYIAAGEAVAAWLHYRAGEWAQAQVKAEAAVANWEGTIYPLQWLGYWPLLAIALQQERLPNAIAPAQVMLNPGQQKLPAEIEAALATAVAAWEAGDESAVQTSLKTAVELAGQHGYL